MYGLKTDWWVEEEERPRHFVLEDYQGAVPRWCPGCGDHAVLTALQKVLRDEHLAPEQTVVVSGIGCSGRFPHYLSTYGFHGLHGRALPVACGVRARRPELHVFVVTGDGDCCAIGTAHWIHAVRYNMKMTVIMLDNNIYGLTKMQSSPTTPRDHFTFTHPYGVPLDPLNPLEVTLGITNVSFVAQSVDWQPAHIYQTLLRAHRHPGFAFVRILQRCPHYMADLFEELRKNPPRMALLDHPDGVPVSEGVRRAFPHVVDHDPSDLAAARHIASGAEGVPVGLLYCNPEAQRYDLVTAQGLDTPPERRLAVVQETIDSFRV